MKFLKENYFSFISIGLLIILFYCPLIDINNRIENLEKYHNKNICSECGQAKN